MTALAQLLASIPGWEDAAWRELHGGLTNRSFLVENKGQRAVLKVDDGPRGTPYNSRVEEATVQSAAAAIGIAAPVIYASDTLYLTEYVEGDVWRREYLETPSRLESLAAGLRQLHSMPLTGRSFDALAAAEQYRSRIDAAHVREAERCLGIVASAGVSRDLRCCHNDLVAENIVSTPDVLFLDFEYACDNDPLFDLAIIVEHHSLSEAAKSCLLDAYFDGDVSDRRDALGEQRRIYSALSWLWQASRS